MYIDPATWAACEFGADERDVAERAAQRREQLAQYMYWFTIFQKREDVTQAMVVRAVACADAQVVNKTHGQDNILIKGVHVMPSVKGKFAVKFGFSGLAHASFSHFQLMAAARDAFRKIVEAM